MNLNNYKNGALATVIEIIPDRIMKEIEALCKARRVKMDRLDEIRLRGVGVSSVVLSGENVCLCSRVDINDIHSMLKRACDAAVYAHRDEISNGFVSIAGGCRVGVCGYARYDNGKIVGVSEVSALVFRIPSGRCDFADKLFGYWRARDFCGMLICSKAGVGKTTAIRSLAKKAASEGLASRVVVVDERCEFDPYEYRNSTVDILRGYKRSKGIEIAIRTMSAQIIIVDEIGNEEDSDALIPAAGTGVSIVATAHGDTAESVLFKPSVKRLCDVSLFDAFAIVSLASGRRDVSFISIEGATLKQV